MGGMYVPTEGSARPWVGAWGGCAGRAAEAAATPTRNEPPPKRPPVGRVGRWARKSFLRYCSERFCCILQNRMLRSEHKEADMAQKQKEDLQYLIEEARKVEMTETQIMEQRESFAYGNSAIENPDITKELVAEVAKKLISE